MAEKIGIVAFAFGVPATILSNRLIAKIASASACAHSAPVYTQLDIQVESGVDVEYTDEVPGIPPPTLRIARRAVRWAEMRKLTTLLVVAAKPHLWRCIRDLNQALREAKCKIEVRTSTEVENYPEDRWFCLDSTQERTQVREAWEKRERVLRKTPFFLYKRIAS